MLNDKKWFILFSVLILSACGNKDSRFNVDPHGFILGDDSKPPIHLVIGVGESVDQFIKRNPSLQSLKLAGGDTVLDLPLMTRADAIYDDGDVRFAIGCSFTTNIFGNYGSLGVNSVGFDLCDPAVNDWRLATSRASRMIAAFEKQNPGLLTSSPP